MSGYRTQVRSDRGPLVSFKRFYAAAVLLSTSLVEW